MRINRRISAKIAPEIFLAGISCGEVRNPTLDGYVAIGEMRNKKYVTTRYAYGDAVERTVLLRTLKSQSTAKEGI